MAQRHEIPEDVGHELEQMDRLYENADPKLFDYFAKDLTAYPTGGAEVFVGLDAYRRHFEPNLKRAKRKLSVLDRRGYLAGNDTAVVAQAVNITQEDVVATIRQSLIFTKQNGRWLVSHLHTAFVGSPVTTHAATSVKEAQVLSERIATVAAVLGVAQ